MRTIEYVPEIQPHDATEKLKFILRPLTQEEFGELAFSMRNDAEGNSVPTYKATTEVFKRNVTGWENYPGGLQCTLKSRIGLLSGAPSHMLTFWMGAIAGTLYLDALMTEAERKN